jgi:hypothetical protein
VVAVYRRAAENTMTRLKEAFLSEHPMRALWKFSTDPACTALAGEFMAMANHRKAIRAEIASSTEDARKVLADALGAFPFDKGSDMRSPLGLTVLIAGISRLLVMETSLGISLGHGEARAIVENWIRQIEKDSAPRAKTRTQKPPQRTRRAAKASLR